MSLRAVLEDLAGNYEWYRARRSEFATGQRIPFRVSPEPLRLASDESRALLDLGDDITAYFDAVHELYQVAPDVHRVLSVGKPAVMCEPRQPKYLLLRPDLIMTEEGLSLCEIETSPFGLALSDLLDSGYRRAGFDTLAHTSDLAQYIRATTPCNGSIIYTHKTSAYHGQLAYLADNLFSGPGRRWSARLSTDGGEAVASAIYRAFYLAEYVSDPSVRRLLDAHLESGGGGVYPSVTPHLEEKAVLAVLWDSRWKPFLISRLGQAAFTRLRTLVPPTWVVGSEEHFEPGLPYGVTRSEDLASLPRSRRRFVLKVSGFSASSSWSEGVCFLHEKSAERSRELIRSALNDDSAVYVLQEFRKARTVPMVYEDGQGGLRPMRARVRLTPYFGTVSGSRGRLLSIKATGCENTDYIHASSASINTVVVEERSQLYLAA